MSMKILYAGSPQASQLTLSILYERQKECGFEIAGVLSNPPSAKGRHKELIPTSVASFAIEKNIPLFTPEHIDEECRNSILPLGADLLVSFAYGHIFGPKFLALFPAGGVNVHPSLLPKYRGCTPVPAAILNSDDKTAVTVQTLSLKMDEGNILKQREIILDGTETGESLLNDCAKIGAELLCELLKEMSSSVDKKYSLPSGIAQSGEPSYTYMISKEDGKIDWSEDARKIEAKVRAYYPEPGTWCLENQMPLRILQAANISNEDFFAISDVNKTVFENSENGKVMSFKKGLGIFVKAGSRVLVVKTLQRQGKKVMSFQDFLNGARDFIGSVLK